MKGIHTLDGVIQAEFPSSRSGALRFLAKYPWRRISEISPDHVVVEEIGRNTGRVFGFRYEGTSAEMQPVLSFLYLFQVLRGACFCAPSPDWREKILLEAVEEAQRFPEDARVPLAIACSCIKDKEFENLAKVFSANISTVPNPVLLEPGVLPDFPYPILTLFRAEIAMMLISGVSAKEDILVGIQAAVRFEEKKEPEDLLAAAELSRDGLCSFGEALAL